MATDQDTSKHHRPLQGLALAALIAAALAIPAAAQAGPFDKAKARIQNKAAQVGQAVRNLRERRPLASAIRGASANLPGARLIETVRELQLKEQLQSTIALIREMQADYHYFAGGPFGCEAECAQFREDLKGVFDDFLTLVEEVPVLSAKPGLFDRIARVADLVDYVPPRALYLMWQALDGRIDDVRGTAEKIRELLQGLPTLDELAFDACEWADHNEDSIGLVQLELERMAWLIGKIEGFIPDIEIKAEAGAEAGVAFANGTASAGAGFKPTDPIKIALKILATIPEAINWSIKLNLQRAKVVCPRVGFVAK